MRGAGTDGAPAIMKQNASTRAATSSCPTTPPGSISRQLVASGSFRPPAESHRVRARRGSRATRPGIQARPVGMSPRPMRRCCCLLCHRVVPGALLLQPWGHG